MNDGTDSTQNGTYPRLEVHMRSAADQPPELIHPVELAERRETLIQHPETGDFLRGALVEAAYQRERWPEQDEMKSDQDWYWTLGFICGKALRNDVSDHDRLHHIEAAAALLANWHHAVKGRTNA